MAEGATPAAGLSPLRDELILHAGPANRDGSPSWTLEDPLRGLYFRIGWAEMAMLSRWSVGNAAQIVAEINQTSALTLDDSDVQYFNRFLQANSLTRVSGDDALAQFTRQVEQSRVSIWRKLLKNYLFFRIPLWHPDRFLAATLPWIEPFFSRTFLKLTLLVAALGLFLAGRQWETFKHTFLHFFTLEGAALAGLTLCVTKILHELGHAYTCKRFGARVATMGVAFLVMMPVLYTDTSGSWKLTRRRQRMAIGAAGMMTELALAAWATLAWSFLPDGMLRSAAFMLATTTWIMTLAINLSPLMRFDGYFLLSDGLQVPNLQNRGFAIGRWKMREWLFGLGDAPPEHFPRWLQRTLVGYAFAVWIYRFFLFTGIAILVYHMAFKLLGMLLFAIEIGYFVVMPVVNEVREWSKRRKDYRMNRNMTTTLAVSAVVLILLMIPWQRSVYAPALLRAEQQSSLYMPVPAMIQRIEVQVGQPVHAGQTLFTLSSDALAHERQQLERQIATLNWQSTFQVFNKEAAGDHQRVKQEHEAALQKLQVLQRQSDQLTVRAPIDGVVADMATPLEAGEWLGQGEWLAVVTKPTGGLVEAFVSEKDWQRLSTGAKGTFYLQDVSRSSLPLTIVEIASTATRDLNAAPELASVYGGDIATLSDAQRKLHPEQAVYRVLLSLPADYRAQPQVLRGTVVMDGEAQSLLIRGWKVVSAVLIRELSF
ncbi:HlyD family efflux transporter periplasmic adaptor subunit [Pectobacterium parmentieri]|uniref:HlyD family efflux transporter periplasmic adaptor subunit n=1 Tax=Pectobacterium parmentieri TaxID=1905730 RepID=A0A0H3I0K0_PECPM|nr:HlyD family efflux transporter periplasmic adaptor subunit [Pectobacterium parmentieri]AFI88918.1 Putative membrane Zinc metallopeptidase, M50 family [Pectobacterium parmentieri]MBI0470952.1 HlyD family efflux transporter periplasmic adaptor subunit [Pectobacterium parmentieri]MBI0492445.1 HlyD family efflux transporter periplasmic adaptor subunit [Pectobacterium parmentieri]MBI0555071.1 HlyD family efflux transporter periplasmic adaptor subunit [Pectobacterium parmentieri]MBI0568326.1 HlyD